MNPPQPTLTVIAGPDKDRVYTLKAERSMLGRNPECLYRLNDMRTSRYHCEIEVRGDDVWVYNHGNTSGTLIDGVAISVPTKMRSGQVLQVGETLLRLNAGTETIIGSSAPRPAADYDEAFVEELTSLSGRKLVRYELGEILGKGNTSMVFKALNTEDNTVCAVKVMNPEYSKHEDEVQRFIRAMTVTMPFKHPNIIRTLAAGKNGPYCWVALELIEGESLTSIIRRIGVANMLDWKYAFRVGLHIGRALTYAHSQGVIHRDIAPSNIMIQSPKKTAKLGDLMLAKALEGAQAKQITGTGEIVGDINFLSPERASGSTAIDARSDLFSLGVTCYTLLSGKPPFTGGNFIETVMKIRTAAPLKPSTFQMGIPSSFEHAILKMIEKKPEDRFQSAADWVTELERIGRSNAAPLD